MGFMVAILCGRLLSGGYRIVNVLESSERYFFSGYAYLSDPIPPLRIPSDANYPAGVVLWAAFVFLILRMRNFTKVCP